MTERLRYLPALDGLRAFAVLGVICYHGGLSWTPGGFLGVDLFFVLSGFLITTLLLGEWGGTRRIDLRAFWGRRARRLLPALFLVLAAVVLYAALMAQPSELRTIRGDALATLGYVANWRFIFAGQSYFAQFGAPSPLKHMWSLAIEEQFYLLWPLIVFACLRIRRGSSRGLATVSVLLLAGSVSLMALLYQPGHDPSRVYYGTDTRAQSLLVGALLGMLLIRYPGPARRVARGALQIAGVIAAGTLAYLWATISDHSDSLYRGGLLFQALLAAIVITAVVQPRNGPLGAALSWGPLRWIGRISYGLYLWHWPIFVAIGPGHVALTGYPLFALRVGVTFVVATLSYYLVEMPIRRGTFKVPTLRLATPAVAIVLVGAVLIVTAGAPPAPIEVSAGAIRVPTVPSTQPGHVGPRRIMLVGDSVANSLAPGLQRAADAQGFALFNASIPGCGTLVDTGERWIGQWAAIDDRCLPTWKQRWPGQVAEFQPDVVVLMLSGHDTVDRRFGSHQVNFDSPLGAALYTHELETAIRMLSGRGAHVVVLTEPYFREGWPQAVDKNRSSFNDAWVNIQNSLAARAVSTMPDRAVILDLNKLLDPTGHYVQVVNGQVVRQPDLIHLNDVGADMVASWLVPQILALGPGTPQPGQSGAITPSAPSNATTNPASVSAG